MRIVDFAASYSITPQHLAASHCSITQKHASMMYVYMYDVHVWCMCNARVMHHDSRVMHHDSRGIHTWFTCDAPRFTCDAPWFTWDTHMIPFLLIPLQNPPFPRVPRNSIASRSHVTWRSAVTAPTLLLPQVLLQHLPYPYPKCTHSTYPTPPPLHPNPAPLAPGIRAIVPSKRRDPPRYLSPP